MSQENEPSNITHRQWIVGQALQGLLASGHFTAEKFDDGPWYLNARGENGNIIFAVDAANRIANAVIATESKP